MFSAAGLPIVDVTSYGLFYVAEVLEHPPVADSRGLYRAQRLNAHRDGDSDYREPADLTVKTRER